MLSMIKTSSHILTNRIKTKAMAINFEMFFDGAVSGYHYPMLRQTFLVIVLPHLNFSFNIINTTAIIEFFLKRQSFVKFFNLVPLVSTQPESMIVDVVNYFTNDLT